MHITFSWDRADLDGVKVIEGKEGLKFWYPTYDIVMVAGPAKLEFTCIFDGVKKGEAQAVDYNSPMTEDGRNRAVEDPNLWT